MNILEQIEKIEETYQCVRCRQSIAQWGPNTVMCVNPQPWCQKSTLLTAAIALDGKYARLSLKN